MKTHAHKKLAQNMSKVYSTTAAVNLSFASTPNLSHCRTMEVELKSAGAGVKIHTALIDASWVTGSDTRKLATRSPEHVADHFHDVASLVCTLGEAPLPAVAILDGMVMGGALGIGAHASACVVTERTRMRLLGPQFGFLPESFASFALSKLPFPGLGAYLALTGALLTGPEMADVGLATHTTESHTVPRLHEELSRQRQRALGLSLRNLEIRCVELRPDAYDKTHALYYRDQIAECFSQSSVSAILSKLRAGDSPWHMQAAHCLSLASPLMLALTLETLRRSAALEAERWPSALRTEAVLCSNVVSRSPDFARGAESLQATKEALLRQGGANMAGCKAKMNVLHDVAPMQENTAVETAFTQGAANGSNSGIWEHRHAEDVTSDSVAQYFNSEVLGSDVKAHTVSGEASLQS